MSQTIYNLFSTFLRLLGVNLNEMTFFAYTKCGFVILLTILWCIFNIVDIYMNWKSVDDLGKGIIIPMSLRVFYNMANFLLNFETWKSIIAVCKCYNFSVEKQAGREKLILRIVSIIKVYTLLAVLAVVAFATVPMLQGNLVLEQYPFCDFQDFKCYLTVNIVEVCYLVLLLTAILAYDILYVYLILSVYFETEGLKEYLMEIDFNMVDKQTTQTSLYSVIERHLRVISLSSQMRDMYSNMLLFQYQATTLSTCVLLFLLCADGIPPSLGRFAQNGVPLTVILLQMILYCIGGSILKNQGLSISDAIFETNWWTKTQPDTRRTLALMIQASQKPTILTIGEVMQLGLDSVVKALRTSISIFTLMRNIQQQ